jgi:hypothetical protein
VSNALAKPTESLAFAAVDPRWIDGWVAPCTSVTVTARS